MRLLGKLSLLLLIGLALAAPKHDSSESKESKESKESVESKESKEKNNDDRVTITKEFFQSSFVIYKSKHEIVNIMVPLNSLNFDDDSEDDDTSDDVQPVVFFVEADLDSSGGRDYKGLYMLNKDRKAQKLLENGRDAAASSDDSKEVFFAASDGIYVYKQNDSAPTKYGTFDEGVTSIAKANNSDAIYVLTDSRDLYKVTEEGQKKEKLEEVVKAKEIVLDYSDNLYFYGDDLQPYVVTDGVKKIEGLPSNPKSVKLIKPMFLLEEGVPFISDNEFYVIYANGTSEKTDFDMKSNAKPTAYSMEATLIQYYGYHKKIYEFNILSILMSELLDDLKTYLEPNSSAIRSMSTRSRSSLRPK